MTIMKRSLPLLLLFSLCLSSKLGAQAPTIQDCLGAIAVCQEVYIESTSPSGDGNFPNEINTSISCTAGELNSIWYTFTVNEAGFLGFVITPNDLNDDYDWALYNITNRECSDIKNVPSMQVSCNAAGGPGCNGITGANGGSSFNVQGAGCGSPFPDQFSGRTTFNDRIPMLPGNTYALMVSNWSQSPNGYQIDFSSSTGLGIIDQTRPTVENIIVPDECGETQIALSFSENIQCETFNSNNYELVGPGGPYTLTPIDNLCSEGGEYEKDYVFEITPPIGELGTFTFNLISDESTEILDLCGNPSELFSFEFEVNFPLFNNAELGPDTTLLCEGEVLTLDVTIPFGSYQWQDGSSNATFEVSTSGIYAVTATNDCDVVMDAVEIIYQMDVPQIELGADQTLCPGDVLTLDAASDLATYVWQDGSTGSSFEVNSPGIYNVEVTNACGTVSDEIEINYILPIQLDLGQDQVLCDGEELALDVTNADVISYQWQDGSNSPLYTITTDGTYAVTITTACEVQTDEVTVTFITEPNLMLGNDTLLCIADAPLIFDLSVPGANYTWQDGSSSSTYQVTQSGNYAVTVTTACNVFTSSSMVTVVDSIEQTLVQDTFLCPGERLILNAKTSVFAEYLWSGGTTEATLPITEAGEYQVLVFNECEERTFTANIAECERCVFYGPSAFSPNNDGVNDEFRPLTGCEIVAYDLTIFDRWGNLLFETTDPDLGWDGVLNGQLLPTAVYLWSLEYTVMENGRPESKIVNGDVAIVK